MKKVLLSSLLLGLFSVTTANAMTYKEGIAKVQSIESKYNKCLIADGKTEELDHGSCFIDAQDGYDKLISSIRKSHSKAINPKVWQAVNLGHVDRAKACSNEHNYLLTRVYYVKPHLLCQEQAFKSLALAAVKLHLK